MTMPRFVPKVPLPPEKQPGPQCDVRWYDGKLSHRCGREPGHGSDVPHKCGYCQAVHP